MFVSRCAKSFGEQLEYVFWCSCDPKRAQLVDCLPTVNTESFQTFEQQLPPCQHIMAARIVLEEVDSINDISPSLEFAGMPFNRTGEVGRHLEHFLSLINILICICITLSGSLYNFVPFLKKIM